MPAISLGGGKYKGIKLSNAEIKGKKLASLLKKASSKKIDYEKIMQAKGLSKEKSSEVGDAYQRFWTTIDKVGGIKKGSEFYNRIKKIQNGVFVKHPIGREKTYESMLKNLSKEKTDKIKKDLEKLKSDIITERMSKSFSKFGKGIRKGLGKEI